MQTTTHKTDNSNLTSKENNRSLWMMQLTKPFISETNFIEQLRQEADLLRVLYCVLWTFASAETDSLQEGN